MDDIILELSINLWHGSLVYLPRTFLYGDSSIEKELIDQFSDRLIMLDKDVGAYYVGKSPVKLKVMQKSTLLSDNLFKLLQLREQYTESASKYLFGKYMAQVEGFTVLSEWFIENISNKSTTTRGQLEALNMQRSTYNAHLKELRVHSIEERELRIGNDRLKQEALTELKGKLQSQKWEPPVNGDRKARLQRIKEEAKEHTIPILRNIFNVKFRED